MTEKDILDISNNNNGYLYSDLLKQYNIDSSYISRLAKKGEITKVAPGIYITKKTIEDEFYINSIRYSKIVYSGDTAIFLNGLSNKQFPELEASIPYGTHIPKIEGFIVRQSRSQNFSLGIAEIETPFGNKVRCYDKERCICDLFIRPDNYDYEDRVYAIKEYKNNYLNFDKLYEYAKILGVYEIVRSVFEVVGWN